MKPPCKDCAAEWKAWEEAGGAYAGQVAPKNSGKRPAPYPGPRCYTHHQAERRRVKAARHANYVGRTYGLPDGFYDALVAFQGGVCAICERANGKTRKLSVDHDHACCNGPTSCGKCVRGALCRPCNDLLGHIRDSPDTVLNIYTYLRNPPAKRMKWPTT